MEPSMSSIIAVLAQLAAVMAAGMVYLRRARVDRPPVGVFNRNDVLLVAVVLVIVPVVYLRLPMVALAVVFVGLSIGMLYFAMAPLVRSRPAAGIAIVLVGLDVVLAEVARDSHPWLFNAVNNVALAIMLVGMCNMWVQSGVRARHVAALGAGVAVYDVVATFGVPMMGDLVDRLSSLPLTPMLMWGEGDAAVGAGLGDLLLILLWTLVAEKAFSRRAGITAAALGLSCSFALFLAFWLDIVNQPLPAMVVLGPAMAIHYRLLARKTERERTMAEYLDSLELGPVTPTNHNAPAVKRRPARPSAPAAEHAQVGITPGAVRREPGAPQAAPAMAPAGRTRSAGES